MTLEQVMLVGMGFYIAIVVIFDKPFNYIWEKIARHKRIRRKRNHYSNWEDKHVHNER